MSLPKIKARPTAYATRPSRTACVDRQSPNANAIHKVYVEPTTRCNLDCPMCIRHGWNESVGDMKSETFDALLRSLGNLQAPAVVQFSGFGEPLMHPRLADMLRAVSEAGHETELITNAARLTRQQSEALVQGGLNRLFVSIDGLSEETYGSLRGGRSLAETVRRVQYVQNLAERAERDHFELGIEFVAMKRNRHELGRLPILAAHLGARFVVVTNVLPYCEEMIDETLYGCWTPPAYPSNRFPPSPIVSLPLMDPDRENLDALRSLTTHLPNLTLLHHPPPMEPAYCRFVNEGRVAVRWDGEVSPCLPLLHSHRCYPMGREKQIRHCSYGNVNATPLSGIWTDPSYSALRDRIRRFDFPLCSFCGGCEDVDRNETDCFGNPFPACGDCLWARGIVQCP